MFKFTELEISRRLALASFLTENKDYSVGWLPGTSRPAAVLIPFLRVSNEWHILFTRRTEKVADHKGQVAFPGGSVDPGDPSPEFTALREAEEEIGLHGEDVRVLGRMQELQTTTNYRITPVVGTIPWPYPLELATDEVSRTFTIPLNWLADPTHHEICSRFLPSSSTPLPVIYFKTYHDELLWGVSAQITVNLLITLGLLMPHHH